MTIDWNAVGSAVVTALLVTYVVEYLAKPRLEVRKERILDAMRVQAEFLAAVVGVSQAAQFLLVELPAEATTEDRAIFEAEKERQYGRLRELVLDLFDNLGKYAVVYRWPQRDLVMSYVSCLWGVVQSTRTRDRKAEIIGGLGAPMATALERPRLWRAFAPAFAFGEVRRRISETEEPRPPEPDPSAAGT